MVSEKCRKKILEQLHEGHPGVVRMKSQARSHVWWPGIDHDIENVVKACHPLSLIHPQYRCIHGFGHLGLDINYMSTLQGHYLIKHTWW